MVPGEWRIFPGSFHALTRCSDRVHGGLLRPFHGHGGERPRPVEPLGDRPLFLQGRGAGDAAAPGGRGSGDDAAPRCGGCRRDRGDQARQLVHHVEAPADRHRPWRRRSPRGERRGVALDPGRGRPRRALAGDLARSARVARGPGRRAHGARHRDPLRGQRAHGHRLRPVLRRRREAYGRDLLEPGARRRHRDHRGVRGTRRIARRMAPSSRSRSRRSRTSSRARPTATSRCRRRPPASARSTSSAARRATRRWRASGARWRA